MGDDQPFEVGVVEEELVAFVPEGKEDFEDGESDGERAEGGWVAVTVFVCESI